MTRRVQAIDFSVPACYCIGVMMKKKLLQFPRWYWIYSAVLWGVMLIWQFGWLHSPVGITGDVIMILLSIRMYYDKTIEMKKSKQDKVIDDNDIVM